MSHQNSTTNWVLHDQNGQPQVFKLVPSPGSKGGIGGLISSSIGGQPIKAVFKSPASGQESSQGTVITPGTQIVRTVNMPGKIGGSSKYKVVVPVSQIKGSDGQIVSKTIRLSSPMTNIKLVNAINSPKVQQIQTASAQVPKSYISPILDHSGSRKRQEIDSEFTPEYKRRKTEKVGKGLRHFSMKVCEKVRKKGTTSYNEVADELVGEFTNPSFNNPLSDQQYDQKNIRRRVYDALNVLMAMNIISKEKKEIKWLGLPTNSLQECIQLEKEKQKKIQRIREKTKQLHELILRQISFKNLVQRNKTYQNLHGPPPTNSTIQLPFIVVNTNKKTVIECSISNNKMDYIFDFNDKFEIHDDMDVLKRLGLLMGLDKGEVSPENLERFMSFVPKSLEEYVIQLANGDTDPIKHILESAGPGPSSMNINPDDLGETTLGENMSHQSSISDPLSPSHTQDFSDEEAESDDMSSDVDIN